jgi:multiple sugar transport system permease protein
MTDRMMTAVTAPPPPEMNKRSLPASVVVHTLLIIGSLLMIYPLLWMVSASVRPQDEIFSSTSIIPSSVDFSSYLRGWVGLDISFGRFFWNSLVISVLSVTGNVVACSLTAYAFARLRFAGRNFWFAIMLGTLMIPYHVTLIPQYVLFLNLGWVNTILPLVVPKFLGSDAFFIFLMVQFFRGIPRELDEAAMMDGCSAWRIYWKIMLPLSLPVLATAAIFSFIWTWDDFFGPLIYLNDMNTYTIQLGLRTFVDSTSASDWGGLFAMSTLSLVPVFIFFLFFQRLLIEGIATTGMKR